MYDSVVFRSLQKKHGFGLIRRRYGIRNAGRSRTRTRTRRRPGADGGGTRRRPWTVVEGGSGQGRARYTDSTLRFPCPWMLRQQHHCRR